MSAIGQLLTPIPAQAFALYAMSLPQGPNFGDDVLVSAWESDGTSNVLDGLYSFRSKLTLKNIFDTGNWTPNIKFQAIFLIL